MEEKILTVELFTVPENRVLFKVLKDGKPVAGATVERVQQTSTVAGIETPILDPTRNLQITDENGEALYVHPPEFDPQKFYVFAYIPNSSAAFIKSDWKLTHGESYDLKLKEYSKPPTMFVEFGLRDILGADAYGSALGAVEKWSLENAGFTNVKVSGKGTSKLRVEFTPPFVKESPLIIGFAATTKGIIALILVIAILGVIYITIWRIGAKAIPAVGVGLGIAIFLLILAAAKGRK